MKKKTVCKAVVSGLFFGAVSPAWGIDIGTHIYAEDKGGKSGNVEFYYENHHQGINAMGASGKVYTDSETEDKRYMARMNYYVGAHAIFYIEGGLVTDDRGSSSDDAPIFGAGFKIKVYNSPFFDLNVFAAATYIPTMEDIDYYATSPLGEVTITTNHSIAEFNGGLSVSKVISQGDISWTPYGGLMLVKLDSERDYEIFYHAENRSEERDGYLEENNALAGFAGVEFTLNNALGLRLEGRFSSETSYSVGLNYSF